MRRFFIEPSHISLLEVQIIGSDAAHIYRVLRMKPGDLIGVFDGTGMEYEARITQCQASLVHATVIRSAKQSSESPLHITVAQSLLKDKKMDGLIRQLTELGINRWIPFLSERSVPRPDKHRSSNRMDRWEKIAVEALKQCRRSVAPEICDIVTYAEAIEIGKLCPFKVIFWEQSDHLSFASHSEITNSVFIMIGPEGGFTEQEVEYARSCDFRVAGMGPRILRSETAAIAATTIMQYLFGDMRNINCE